MMTWSGTKKPLVATSITICSTSKTLQTIRRLSQCVKDARYGSSVWSLPLSTEKNMGSGEDLRQESVGASSIENAASVCSSKLAVFDPGKTTGFALRTVNDALHTGQVPVEDVWMFLNYWVPEVIVYERFDYRPNQRHADLTGVEVIGIIKEWARQNLQRCRKVVDQAPSEGKFFWTDRKLRQRGLHIVGQPHANDAVRHLLYYEKDFRL